MVLACLTASPCAAAASGDKKVAELGYQAYYGGLSAVEIKATVSVSKSAYEVSAVGNSIGFLDFLFSFQSHAHGTGPLGSADGPFEFSLKSTYRGRSRQITGQTKPGSDPVWSVQPPIPLDERDPVPVGLRIGSLDPLAALVATATRDSARETCTGTVRVFNGKVRTDIHLAHLGSGILNPHRLSDFSGPAEKCEARYETLAGGYKKSWFAEDGPPPIIHFWISRLDGSNFWIPVRAEANTGPAKVLVHLTSAIVRPDRSIKLR